MGFKLATAVKVLGSTALIGLAAVTNKQAGDRRKAGKTSGCTPCKIAAMSQTARQSVKNGRLF